MLIANKFAIQTERIDVGTWVCHGQIRRMNSEWNHLEKTYSDWSNINLSRFAIWITFHPRQQLSQRCLMIKSSKSYYMIVWMNG